MQVNSFNKPVSFGNSNIINNNPQNKNTYVSFALVNDLHGKLTNGERIVGIIKEFDQTPPSKLTHFFDDTQNHDVIKMKFASGDMILGANYNHNIAANKLTNNCHFDASTLGNHEVDVNDPINLAKLLTDGNYKMLAANIEIDENSPLKEKIKQSIVIERNGEKFGIIGIAPSDMNKRVKMNPTLKDIHVQDLDATIKTLKKEVKKFNEQGINKIILLSHSGLKNDQIISKQVEGIDFIFGGHSHELIKGITEGINLFYSEKGEPVVITQAGKDGENIGVLNTVFDKDGRIIKVQNNIINVRSYNRALPTKFEVEAIIGKPEIIGKIKNSVPPPKIRLLENNPHGNLIVDAMRYELDTDIALLNAGNIRGSFSQGPIDTRLISDITPFDDKMMVLDLTEPQIVKAIKYGCNSVNKTSNKPGIILVSGLKYKFNKEGKLLELNFIDKNNNVHKIDVDNPDKNKKYTVAADDFFATGGDGYMESNKNPDFVLKKLNYDKNILACNYIKKQNQPIEIKYDDRVVMVD